MRFRLNPPLFSRFRSWLLPNTLLLGVIVGTIASCTSVPESGAGSGAADPDAAAPITLKVHHFLPSTSTTHAQLLEPWAEAVETDSQGRIQVEVYPSMQLGGKAPQLYDQAKDGVVDAVWTLTGYTPGRFPLVEVFELPFVADPSAEVTSQAIQDFSEQYLTAEFAEVKPLAFHVHAPGSFHMNGTTIASLEDLKGVKVRAPSRISNRTLELLGATPVGMPVPEVPESLSRRVIDGALLPYEVTQALKVHELTDSHTEIVGDRGLYTAVFLFAMNRDTYEALPPDLQAVIDDNSGLALAKRAGQLWDVEEVKGREAAAALNHEFYQISGSELARWQRMAEPVITEWAATATEAGADAELLLSEMRRLVAEYGQAAAEDTPGVDAEGVTAP